MRLPRLLSAIFIAILCSGCVFAADDPLATTNGNTAVSQAYVPAGPLLKPQMFIPPHAQVQIQTGAKPSAEDGLCYNIHSIVVAEEDHTGVTRPVSESTCTRASRFQMKEAGSHPTNKR